jgi:hypothetical protein
MVVEALAIKIIGWVYLDMLHMARRTKPHFEQLQFCY